MEEYQPNKTTLGQPAVVEPQNSPSKSNRWAVLIIIILIIGAIGAGIWYFMLRDDKSSINSFAECKAAGNPILESYPEQCIADGKSFTNPDQSIQNDQSSQTQTETEQKYLEITEWGVRIPISQDSNTEDMIYRYVKNDSYESVFFTFQRLVDFGICKEDAGVALTRSKTENVPPYNIDSPEQFKSIDGYYYSFAYANGGPCYDSEKQAEVSFYQSTRINRETITNAVEQLYPVPPS